MPEGGIALFTDNEKYTDTDIFNYIYGLANKDMCRIAYRYLHNREDTEDAVQSAFEAIARKISIFYCKDDTEIKKLTAVIVRCTAIRIYNRNCREDVPFSDQMEETVSENDDPDNNIEVMEIRKLINGMKYPRREVLDLVLICGFSAKETSRMLGIPETTVYDNLFKGKREIRQAYKKGERK